MYVYVITEDGEVYPSAYSTYESAFSAVQMKHPEEYEESKESDTSHELYGVKEDKSGTTNLYIEKGIHIVISKLPVKPDGGRRRRTTRSRRG